MSWNYRIIRYEDGSYGLHEVYYSKKDGQPIARTDRPVAFGCCEDEGPEGVVQSLEMALNDAKSRDILDDPWPKTYPSKKGRKKNVVQKA